MTRYARIFAGILAAAAAVMLASAPARAQELADYDYTNLSFRGVGFSWGRIWPSKVVPVSTWTVRADLGFLGPAVRIMPNLTYWSSRLRARELDEFAARLNELPAMQAQGAHVTGDDLGRVDWSDLSAGVDAQVVWTAPLRTLTYIGGGVALHALNGRGNAVASTFVEDLLDTTTPGLALMMGLENQPVSRLRLFGEARYTLMSDLHYPELKVGAALMWPAHAATEGGR